MLALGLGEEDAKSPGDSESFSARHPQKHVDHFSDAADRRGKYILNGEVEELHVSMTSEKEQVRLDGSEHNPPHVTLEQMTLRSHVLENTMTEYYKMQF